MKSARYHNVYAPNPRNYTRKNQWKAKISVNGKHMEQYYYTEREAALAVDKFLIKNNLPPVNILKKN